MNHKFAEMLTCTPAFLGSLMKNETSEPSERFFCPICSKSYLRKRHLQRHMRDECIGIPPRFHCDICPSKFRRKYHLVRHLHSKHGIIPPKLNESSSSSSITTKQEYNAEDSVVNNSFNNSNRLSVDALLIKENFEHYLPDLKQIEEFHKALSNISKSTDGSVPPSAIPFFKYLSH